MRAKIATQPPKVKNNRHKYLIVTEISQLRSPRARRRRNLKQIRLKSAGRLERRQAQVDDAPLGVRQLPFLQGDGVLAEGQGDLAQSAVVSVAGRQREA